MKEEDYAELFERPEIKAAIEKPHIRPSLHMLWLMQRGRCYWCDRRCPKPSKSLRRQFAQKELSPNFFTLDHIQSRWQGGGNGADNVAGACYRCNQLRNNAEHKREAGRFVPPNQPEESRLKRLLPQAEQYETVFFEVGLSRREVRIKNREGTYDTLREREAVVS